APVAGARGGALAKQRASGSGVILDPSGYVVTNNHVVQGARRIQVALSVRARPAGEGSVLGPRGRTLGAQLVGADPDTDLAVLKVEASALPALVLGDSEALRQGQVVLAFGAPLGLENSASMGVVSAAARQLEPESPMIYVQTDAPINPGNSGGPLVDVEGRVVGINTMMFSQGGGNEGLGFAVPSNIVRNVFEQIRTTGRVRRGSIGARAQTVTPTLAAGLGLARSEGVVVSDLDRSGGAARGGLELGDVIVALDGKRMENGRQLEVNLYRRAPGELVTLDVVRGDRTLKLSVPVSERPRDPDVLRQLVNPEANLVRPLGLLVLDLDETLMRLLPPTRARAGVVVAVNTGEGPLWPEAPQPGDVVYSLNKELVQSVEGLRAALGKLGPGDPVVLLVERQGELQYLAAELE
ncbi:MAG TPA: trypsin-like peptidase domain-containing protein, partial [Vicinamibacteria bacterium]|nr:trypsin-like peptidase domain-containing protein [Vicinamibacteria bacterium]